MALSFPSDPINGAVSGEYTYDATKGAWRKNAALPVSVAHSDFAPSNPRAGDQWWKSNEGTLFTYYNDGTSSQWVESVNVVANVEPNPIPAGAMMAWASDVIPANWLLCDGSAVSRATYASLFAAVGTTYGSGDGTTTFNLPNLKGKTIVGKDSTQTEFDVLGETGGAKTHTLTSSEMPNHTHSFSGTTSTTGSHNHINGWASITGYNYVGSGGNSNWPFGGGSNAAQRDLQAAGDHSHTFSGTTGAAGSGSAHNNLQPYIVLNYIIKFSAGETPGDSQLAVRVGSLETGTRAVNVGGTGVSTLTSGAYLKGNGTSAISAQIGIPAADITSGNLPYETFPSGAVVQVVQTVYANIATISSGTDSAFISFTGLNTTVTPKRANSKFLISYQINLGVYSGSARAVLLINGNASNTTGTGGQRASTNSIYGAAGLPLNATINAFTGEFLFANSGTNNVVLSFEIMKQDPNYNIYVNRGYTYDDNPRGRPTSTMTILEIVG